MTTVLNQSLAVIVYTGESGTPGAICFVGDLGRDLDEQAKDYMRHEQYSDPMMNPDNIIAAYWHNALEDQYGNRYEPAIRQIG